MNHRNPKRRLFVLLAAMLAMILAAIGLAACGSTDKYTVSFETLGGEPIEAMTYSGEALTLPEPVRTGYDFSGWYADPDCEGEEVHSPFTPTKDITLYAKWDVASHTVHFVTGCDIDLDDAAVPHGETVAEPDPFENYGYEFEGWYAGETAQETFDFDTPIVDDLTLYAKWSKVTYLYLYYGEDSATFRRFTYHAGDVITAEELSELFIPDTLTVDGAACPFDHWVYDERYNPDASEVTGDITVGEEHILLVAVYDYSAVPPKKYLKPRSDGSWEATGNVAWAFENSDGTDVAFSVTTTVTKGASGGAGLAFRLTHSGKDYAYEGNGMSYLAAVIAPANGALDISQISEPGWQRITMVALGSLPSAWRAKYDDALTRITFTLSVVYKPEGFEIYIDGDLAYTFTAADHADTVAYDSFTGTGYGIRCTQKGSYFRDPVLHTQKTVVFDVGEGGVAENSLTHRFGKLNLPTPRNNDETLAFGGWFYDDAFQKPVDLTKPYLESAESEVKLYARWTRDYITVQFEENGGSECESIRYIEGDKLVLPAPTRENRIFTGWFYDNALDNPVDPHDPHFDGDLTLYAGWRYPLAYVTEQDGVYSNTAKASAYLMGETESRIISYIVQMTVTKNGAGGGGIFFRGNVDADYASETTARYIAATITFTGTLQPCNINYDFSHAQNLILPDGTTRNGPVPLNLLPAAWQQKWNGANDGSAVSFELEVRDFEDRYEIYIDGDLACTYRYTPTDLTTYTAYGYGFRATAVGYTWHDIETKVRQYFTIQFEENGGSECDSVSYLEGDKLVLPTPERDNRVFAGWYYDDSLEHPVDPDAPQITGDLTLYASWRYPLAHVEKDNDVYKNTDRVYGGMAGENTTRPVEYSMTLTFEKGGAGGAGIFFRGTVYGDYAAEANTSYFAAALIPNGGNLQINNGVRGFTQLANLILPDGRKATSAIGLSFLPLSWQTKYNAASGTISVLLTVRDFEDRFEIYIDGDLACTYMYTEADLQNYPGIAYGIRATAVGYTWTEIAVRPVYAIELHADNGYEKTVYYAEGETIEETVPDRDPTVEGDTVYREEFAGWYTASEGGERVETATGDLTLYARYERKDYEGKVAVTFLNRVTGEKTVSIIDVGESTAFPAEPSIDTYNAPNGNVTTYTFRGWFYEGGDEAKESDTFESSKTVYAEFDIKTTRNGMPVTEDQSGNDVYHLTGKGTTVPDTTMPEGGTLTAKLTFIKQSASYWFRFAFFVQDANSVNLAGTGAQGAVFVAVNLMSGKLIPGYSFGANLVGATDTVKADLKGIDLSVIKDCAYKQKMQSAEAGSTVELALKVVFGKHFFKFYIDDCLLFVYGDAAQYAGEQLYGSAMTKSESVKTHGTFVKYMDDPKGDKVGLWTFQTIADGSVLVSDIQAEQRTLHKVTYVVDGAEQEAYVPDGERFDFTPPAKGVTGDDENGWFANAFSGWYTAEEGGEPVGAITGDIKVYAHYTQSQVYKVVIDPANGSGTSVEYLAVGSKVQFPYAEKANGKVNGFDCFYTLRGWLMGGQAYDWYAEYTVTADKGNTLTFVAQYDVERFINKVVVTTDEDGDVYTLGNRGSLQGFVVPDHDLPDGGEFSYEITYTKGTANFNHRTALFMQDAGIDDITGTGNQGYIFININLNTGTIILGKKIRGSSQNIVQLAHNAIKACAYKTKFDSTAAGTKVTFSVRVQFGKGWIKYRMDDCLLFTYCADAGEETNYGVAWTEANTSGFADFLAWIKNPEGTKVGFIQWENIANVGGQVVLRKLQYKTLEEIGKAATVSEPQAVTLFIEKKENV